MWTWGAGESGQLGTKRCTLRDYPEQVPAKDLGNEKIASISCGYGHVISLTESGSLYCWGLNCKGQLGLGDLKARYAPTYMELPNGHEVGQIFASGHSSACITSLGKQLCTWGSGRYYRLMSGTEDNLLRPGPVAQLSGIMVDAFAFARQQSAALVKSRVLEV